MNGSSRTRLWQLAAGISVLVALVGLVGYDVPTLLDGADASRDPYWIVLGSFASDVVALVAAYGAWRRQLWGAVLLIVVNVFWMIQAVGTLFDPAGGADVAFALVMGVLHLFALWCLLRHDARGPAEVEVAGVLRT